MSHLWHGTPASVPAPVNPSADSVAAALSEKPRVRHQHSQSMDGLTTIEPEMLLPDWEEPSSAEPNKAISAAELALIDLKRAKRLMNTDSRYLSYVLQQHIPGSPLTEDMGI